MSIPLCSTYMPRWRRKSALISARTKDALAAAKARGVQLGNRTNMETAVRHSAEVRVRKADQHAANVLPIIDDIRRGGAKSLREIAAQLTARGVRTPRGGEWSAAAVRNVLARQAEAGRAHLVYPPRGPPSPRAQPGAKRRPGALAGWERTA